MGMNEQPETAVANEDGTRRSLPERRVVLFDGLCNFCAGSVRFIIRRDPNKRFAFAALQSATGRKFLESCGLPLDSLSTFVLIEGGRTYTRSDAAVRIARHLGGLWTILSLLRFIPRPLRNGVYDWIAHRRYRWFGRRDACLVPTPEEKERFLP